MKNLSIMFKPASSACNMKCAYCFYKDVSDNRQIANYGLMNTDLTEKILDNIFIDINSGDKITFAFQGGEPTLVGLDFYKHFTDYCKPYINKGIKISYALQTNGFLLDENWCKFLYDNDFLVGLSLDGPINIHNSQRFDNKGDGTYKKIISAKNTMDLIGTKYNIITVLTSQLARHPNKVWKFILENKIKYIQFIPCLSSLDGNYNKFALTPERYAGFYSKLFDLWFEYYTKGNYISIKLFDDLVNLLAFAKCNACGLTGKCYPQIIIESDGSVYPCDFFVTDEFNAGNLTKTSLKDIFNSNIMQNFSNRDKPINPECINCKYKNICGGGCQRMFKEVFYDDNLKQCGHKKLLDYIIDRLIFIVKNISR